MKAGLTKRRQKADPLVLARAKEREACAKAVPTSWLDSLLTGPGKVIGSPPYDGKDIERLLDAVRQRILTRI